MIILNLLFLNPFHAKFNNTIIVRMHSFYTKFNNNNIIIRMYPFLTTNYNSIIFLLNIWNIIF